MTKNATLFLVCAIGITQVTAPATAATRVFLLAGQSNMGGVGHGRELAGTSLDKYYAPQPDVKMWSAASNNWSALSSQFEGSDCFGPEVSFGYQMHAAFPKDDIYLVKWSYGGTSLYSDWKPENNAGWCYREFKSTALAAIRNLTDANRAPIIAGMLWMQGEHDTTDATFAAAYQTNLVNFITAVRNDFHTPDMPFVLGRIIQGYGTTENNSTVRTAQTTAPTLIANTAWVNTDDLQISPEIPLHFGTQGQIDLGIRFAAKLTPTPEPSMGMLLLAGAVAGAFRMWRRHK